MLDRAGADQVREPEGSSPHVLGLEANGDRPHPSVVAVEERLGEGADDDGLAHVVACPRAVVPPQHVAGPQAVLGGAAVGLDAVHEVEPVPLRADVAGDAFDRLHEAPAEARVDIRLAPQRLHRRHARGHGRRHEHLGAAVARHPQRRLAAVVGPAAAGQRGDEAEQWDEPAHDDRLLQRVRPHRAEGNRPDEAPVRAGTGTTALHRHASGVHAQGGGHGRR